MFTRMRVESKRRPRDQGEMNATFLRDQVCALAKSNPKKALAIARSISDPWFRAQALLWIARFTEGNPIPVAKEAATAASECADAYKKSAVRAWEIAALAERGLPSQAAQSLSQAVQLAKTIQPISSRSEALLLLLHAAFSISKTHANHVNSILAASCPVGEHWRCKRAVRDAAAMLSDHVQPRKYFW